MAHVARHNGRAHHDQSSKVRLRALPPYPAHPTPLQSFWRALTTFDRTKIDFWMGLRNAIGIALPLATGVVLGYPSLGVVASTGALNVAAADGVDSYRKRAARMLVASVLCAAAVYLGALSGRNVIAASVLQALWAFAAGIAVCLGTVSADIAILSLVAFIIYTAQAMPPANAAWSGLIALAGGLLQTALSIALWPIRGLQPERRAIGDFYNALARAAPLAPNPYETPLASHESALAHEALSSLSGDHSIEAERHFLLVSQAERIRLSLLTLGRCLVRVRREEGGEPAAAAIERFLEIASRLLSAIGRALHGEPLSESRSDDLSELDGAAQALRDCEHCPEHSALRFLISEARLQMDALAGQLRAAVELAGSATPAGEIAFAEREERAPWFLRLSGWLATLRANLSLDSSACRHGIRLAICIAIGDVIARSFSIPRSYWVGMTIALVLKPDFGSTFSRGVLRLAGTYSGLMLATVLFHFVSPAVLVHVLWIGILAFVQRSLGRANYGVMVVAISALIVFLFSLIGVAPKDVISARAWNTTIGGALALAIYLVWPTRERTQARQALASMLDSYLLYFQAVSRVCTAGRTISPRELDRFRTGTRLSRSNVETSVDRLSAEPYADPEQLRIVNAMLASSHRFIHAVMAMEAGFTLSPSSAVGEAFQAFSHDVERTLYFLAARFRGSPVPPEDLPDLREDHNRLIRCGNSPALLNIETDRMTNSLNTLSAQAFLFLGVARAGADGFKIE